jgi:asparagine synthase (glutamine-hydrolysing)
MASTLLRDTDSVSMSRSLEVRVPLLDTPVVEFVNSLPDAARQRAGKQKALLVEALSGLLPEEILGQQKRTFTLPWQEWLRGPLRPKLEASFSEIAPALAQHLHVYVLNEWCRRHLGA